MEKVKLKAIGITGADDEVSIDDILYLSKAFPFVEWAILASHKNYGKPQYPSTDWINELILKGGDVKKALHLCGNYARAFAIDSAGFDINIPETVNKLSNDVVYEYMLDALESFQRVQINIATEWDKLNIEHFARSIANGKAPEYIIQLNSQGYHIFSLLENNLGKTSNIIVPFLDNSGGNGVENKSWKLRDERVKEGIAGGINPTNIESILTEIESHQYENVKEYWVDMQAGIRTDGKFDLNKVEKVLEISSKFI